jgi:hypothetical protein
MARRGWTKAALGFGGAAVAGLFAVGSTAVAAGADDASTAYRSIAGQFAFYEQGDTHPFTQWVLTPQGTVTDGFGNHGTWVLNGSWGGPTAPVVEVWLDGCDFLAHKTTIGLNTPTWPGTFTCTNASATAVPVKWWAVRK